VPGYTIKLKELSTLEALKMDQRLKVVQKGAQKWVGSGFKILL
jgi:hypothetical protein